MGSRRLAFSRRTPLGIFRLSLLFSLFSLCLSLPPPCVFPPKPPWNFLSISLVLFVFSLSISPAALRFPAEAPLEFSVYLSCSLCFLSVYLSRRLAFSRRTPLGIFCLSLLFSLFSLCLSLPPPCVFPPNP